VYIAYTLYNLNLVNTMTVALSSALIQAIIALVAGILILVRPQLLNLTVALFLIVTGSIGIAKAMGFL
jgi:hypothetical protein